jgi:uncharacterized damage-inducible protein DinB
MMREQDGEDRGGSARNDEFRRLVDQSVWANRQWTDFVYSDAEPEDRPRALLGHLMLGERIWFDRIAGVPETPDDFRALGREDLIRGFEANREQFASLIVNRWNDIVDFRRSTGEEYHARVGDIVQHLITHGYHHRGQLAAHYARKGVAFPNTDHINYLIVNGL